MAADNFKPTLWEGALLANFHSVSIADVLATKPTEIKGQKVIFNRVAGGTLKDYSGSVDWDDIDTTPVEMVFDKKKYFAFALDDVDKVQLKADLNRDMKSYRLQKEETVRTPSGAEKQKWIDMGGVKAAVYKKNDMKVAASATYLESTHIGLTRCKSIKAEGYRLVKDDVVYRIIDCNPQGRMTNLLLKVVE